MLIHWDIMKLLETQLGLTWVEVEEGVLRGTLTLSTQSELVGMLTLGEQDREPVYHWAVYLHVWDQTLDAFLVPPVAVFRGATAIRGSVTQQSEVKKLNYMVASLSASLIQVLESAAHDFDYDRAVMAMPTSDRRSVLSVEASLAREDR